MPTCLWCSISDSGKVYSWEEVTSHMLAILLRHSLQIFWDVHTYTIYTINIDVIVTALEFHQRVALMDSFYT